MKIKKMTADFGALRGRSLELGEGLNVITAPNESGKTTWCAFLRAMLYGVDSAERSRAGSLPDKRRFAPWDGAAMAGEMDVSWQDKDVTLRRTGRSSAPMRDFTAVYTGTELPVPGLTAADAGEALTGVGRAVFESTAFIGQNAMRVTPGQELEGRIASIVSSGEEELSFTETEATLKTWQRKRRWRTSGALPELEKDIAQREAALAALERSGGDREALGERVQALEADCQSLRAQVTESRKAARKDMLARSSAGRENLRRAQESAAARRSREKELLAEIDKSPFGRKNSENAQKSAENALENSSKLAQKSQDIPKITPCVLLFALAAVLLAVAGVLFSVYRQGMNMAGWAMVLTPALLAIAAILGGALLLAKRRGKADLAAQAGAERLALLSEFGAADEAALLEALENHKILYEAWQLADAEAQAAEAAFAEAEAAQKALDSTVLEELDFTGGSGEAAVLSRKLAAQEAALQSAREALATAQGRAATLGDPLVLHSELAELNARREALSGQFEAIELALDALRDADEEIQTRFSPRLGERATELFAQLTGGRYDRLTLDKTLRAQARQSGDAAAHDAAYLSAGAFDQMYLALRLAICELTGEGAEPCPLVLDDALACFDDERCAAALEMLKSLAKQRQILLFTCHSREASMLSGDPEVRCISL